MRRVCVSETVAALPGKISVYSVWFCMQSGIAEMTLCHLRMSDGALHMQVGRTAFQMQKQWYAPHGPHSPALASSSPQVCEPTSAWRASCTIVAARSHRPKPR